MELSGLIFVALALVWAVALLPKALRHHDELAQTRSVAGVSDSMRVLARREVVSEREAKLVVTPPQVPAQRRAPRTVEPVQAAASAPATRTPVSGDRVKARIAAQRKAAASAARRRRVILAILLVADLAVGVAAGVGQLPVWTVAVPLTVTVAFLVLARVLVRQEHARWDAELVTLKTMAATSPAAPSVAVIDEPVAAAPPAEPVDLGAAEPDPAPEQARDAHGLAVVSGLDDTSWFPAGLLDEVTPTTDEGTLWDPLPVTLPTYVSKPRATRSVRTIDLQAPGVSSSGHDAASSALVADAATSPPPDDLPQRAVGS